MSIRRLGGTAAVMAAIAGVLAVLTPGIGVMAGTLAVSQRTAETAGPDVLVLSAAGLVAWAVWAWGALGLALTAAGALPGLFGGAARTTLSVVLPAGARRGAALALGLGLGVAGPLLGSAALITPAPAAAAGDDPTPRSTAGVPDWPSPPPALPDWPAAGAPAGTSDQHVVVRGDCLWHIAGDRLVAHGGRAPTDGEVAAATRAWWEANAEVIGPDPDLLLPGQALTPPDPDPA